MFCTSPNANSQNPKFCKAQASTHRDICTPLANWFPRDCQFSLLLACFLASRAPFLLFLLPWYCRFRNWCDSFFNFFLGGLFFLMQDFVRGGGELEFLVVKLECGTAFFLIRYQTWNSNAHPHTSTATFVATIEKRKKLLHQQLLSPLQIVGDFIIS